MIFNFFFDFTSASKKIFSDFYNWLLFVDLFLLLNVYGLFVHLFGLEIYPLYFVNNDAHKNFIRINAEL